MSDAASYDEVPYQSVALVETHPERLAAVASLFGLEPPPVESARILEIGCAGGGNLVPLAQILPGASFVGVDLSPRQVDQARSLADASGASNVRFEVKSVADIEPEFGTFDYILCHGVYSWVPDAVKESILRVCKENLSRDGVAYVSYNTFPGWHVPGMIREMMMYHVRHMADPVAKAKAARTFLDFLGNNVPDRDGHFGKILREESAQLKPHADSYVLHEHLEELNHPIYYEEFARRAGAHGLKVLGDSRVWAMAASAQPPVAAVLDRLSREPVEREQYFDFLCNRRFRRSILCRADAETDLTPAIERLKKLRASAAVWPTVSPVDHASKASIDFRGTDGVIRLTTTDPLFKTALMVLTEAFPRSLGIDELWSTVKKRLRDSGVEPGNNADVLAQRVLQAYCANSVELHAHEPSFATVPSDHPEGLGVARVVAASSAQVPNLRHRQVALSDFDRLVLRQLDGKRSRAEVVDRLVAATVGGEFAIQQNALPVKDPAILRPILERSLEPSLLRLNRSALLMK